MRIVCRLDAVIVNVPSKVSAVALRRDIEDEDRALPAPGRACTWGCNLPPMELFQLPCCYGRLSVLIVSPGPKGPWVTCWRMWKSIRLRACASESAARPGLVAGPACGAQAAGPVDEPRGIHLRPLKRTRKFESESRGASSNPTLGVLRAAAMVVCAKAKAERQATARFAPARLAFHAPQGPCQGRGPRGHGTRYRGMLLLPVDSPGHPRAGRQRPSGPGQVGWLLLGRSS